MENVPKVYYATGETIIREGDSTNNVFLIISGKVKITKKTDMLPVLLATQGKDTIFGEMTMIDGKTRSASVTATEETCCYQCNGEALLVEIKKLPEDIRTALQSMARIIREHNSKIASRGAISSSLIELDQEPNQMTEAEIKNLQPEIAKLTNPFIKSLFRVMMATAFK